MTVGLEKLVQDIKNETSIWPIEKSKNTPEEEAAWDRVGARNKMSGNHVKSIFKVLSKKYETEKSKPNTNWKLFEYLKFLDVKNEPEVEEEEDVPDDADLEDDGEFVELLEVNEYDESEEEDNESAATGSGQSSRNISIEDEQQQKQSQNISNSETEANFTQKAQIIQAIKNQQQKLQTSSPPQAQQQIKQLKGIEVKKVVNSQTKMLLRNSNEQLLNKKLNNSPNETLSVEAKLKQNCEAVRNQTQHNKQQRLLSESLKRKLPAERTTISSDNGHKENAVSPPPAKKQAKEFIAPQGLKVERIVSAKQPETVLWSSGQNPQQNSNDRKMKTITNSADKSVQQLSTNENETVTEMKPIIPHEQQKLKNYVRQPQQNGLINEKITIKEEVIENVEKLNSEISSNEYTETVLPSFFRDLYNSKKYDCFGMYVSSAMNRLPIRLASKLETKILQAIIEVNSFVTNDGSD